MAEAGAPGRRRIVRAAVAAALSLILLAGVAKAWASDGHQLARVVDVLAHPGPGWLVVAVLCEIGSYLLYALAQRRLARAAGHPLQMRWLACLSVAAQGLGNFLPAGYVAANVLNFREFRERGLDPGEATWLLLMTSVLYVGALAALAVAGTCLVGGQAGGPTRYLAIGIAVVAVCLLAGLSILSAGARARPVVAQILRRLPVAARLRRREAVGSALASLARIRLTRRGALRSFGLFALGWALDAACLVASLRAVGAPVPWSTLLVAYCGAQLVSFLPVTPGGLGLVEGSLTVTLASGGLAPIPILAGVILYRAMSYWATLPAGAAGYAVIRRSRPGRHAASRVASSEWPLPSISAAPSNT